MSYNINPRHHHSGMSALMLLAVAVMAAAMAVPAHQSYAQVVDNEGTLSVITTSESPYIYKDSDGRAVVVGEIKNRNALTAMSEIVIRVSFYDRSGTKMLETVRGNTVIDTVPPEGTSPYVVTSESANPDIALASVDVEAFNSSPTKQDDLKLSAGDASNNGTVLMLAGTLANAGDVPSNNTVVHAAHYDAFDPPRILRVESVHAGMIQPGSNATFEFSSAADPRTATLRLFAESDALLSDGVTDVEVPRHEDAPVITNLVTIGEPVFAGPDGRRASGLGVGDVVDITSGLRFQTISDDRIQPYVFFVQIKQSGKDPYVEFLGSHEGSFYGTPDSSASVRWIPRTPGLYFAETFVWDQHGVPISSKGPVTIILVR